MSGTLIFKHGRVVIECSHGSRYVLTGQALETLIVHGYECECDACVAEDLGAP